MLMSDARDLQLAAAQDLLLERYAPDTRVRRIRWSHGETQVLELGDGPPLLLVHGGGDGAFEWVPVLATLAKTHRVLAVDRPGHGLADAFSYRDVDLQAHVRSFLADMLDALELESTDVLANSIGGYWAAVFALAEPQRVRRLVIAGVPPGVVRDAPLPLRVMGVPVLGPLVAGLVMGKPSREGSRKFWGEMLVVHPAQIPDELLDIDAAHMRRNAADIRELLYLLIGPRGVRRQLLLGDRMSTIQVPTLLLFGDRDAFMTPHMEQAWERIVAVNPVVRTFEVPGAGHLPWIDEAESVVDQIERFLRPQHL
jgi:pimeloyl-ACP methyl ester carboxylesterase